MIRFAEFSVRFHGLEFETDERIEELQNKIREALTPLHPNLRFDDDVEIELEFSAGVAERI